MKNIRSIQFVFTILFLPFCFCLSVLMVPTLFFVNPADYLDIEYLVRSTVYIWLLICVPLMFLAIKNHTYD